MPEGRRKTGNIGRFCVEPPLEETLAKLAVAQHSVFHLDQLVALGLSVDAVRKRASIGRLHRLYQSVYSLVPPALLSVRGRYLAAVLACGPGAALSHRAAGALHDLVPGRPSTADVSVPTAGGRVRRKGIRVHRTKTLRPRDVVEADGIPCTSVARTLLDLAGVLDDRGLERALDQATVIEVLDLRALREQIDRHRTLPGAVALQATLERHIPGTTATSNDNEERMLAICRAAGLPDPEVQVWLDLGDGYPMIQPDFLWRAQRLIVEADGFREHGKRHRFESDRRRDARALLAGWRTLRFTSRQMGDPEEVQRTLLAAVLNKQAAA